MYLLCPNEINLKQSNKNVIDMFAFLVLNVKYFIHLNISEEFKNKINPKIFSKYIKYLIIFSDLSL